jgi:hypothetical protein
MTHTYWTWKRDQELIEARATPAAKRNRWQQLIVEDDDRMIAEEHHSLVTLALDLNV